jgi:hypothetical protein
VHIEVLTYKPRVVAHSFTLEVDQTWVGTSFKEEASKWIFTGHIVAVNNHHILTCQGIVIDGYGLCASLTVFASLPSVPAQISVDFYKWTFQV